MNYKKQLTKVKAFKNECFISPKKFSTLFILLFAICNTYAQDPNINNFYTPVPTVKTVRLTVQNKWDNKGNDTSTLQALINSNTGNVDGNKRGATILIPAGKYFLQNIIMKSNIHLLIHKNATIYVANGFANVDRNKHIFRFGPDNTPNIQNTSIQCMSASSGDKFTINLVKFNNAKKMMPITISNVRNFKIRGVKVLEKRSQFQSIDLSPALKQGGGYARPIKGLIQDIEVNNADYGYGLVQMHCGKNIYFKNLFGLGGTTLRLETDYRDDANTARSLVVENVYARDIKCKNGNSAVTLSPHERNNLKVDIARVTANNCGWGVRIEDSFLASSNKRLGNFASNSKIRNVNVKYGNNARVKISHINRYTCNSNAYTIEQNPLLPSTNTLGYKGPSVAGALYEASYSINFNANNHITVLSGSISGPPKVLSGKRNCNGNIANNNNVILEDALFSYKQNGENLTIETNAESSNYAIYNTSGNLILKSNTEFNKKTSVEISSLKAGIYIVRINTPNGSKTSKFLKL